ncbi:PREDICTED: zinc finger protein 407-like [Tinamus guttatus]|uniref:zinc finger protein 407-like n=1 Tax=Tinamus guttatus TaxID=94827 RepID=UPI00052E6ADD|nr:PREDICTED: zinc finger protein 407-like [Tinamus guttatus]
MYPDYRPFLTDVNRDGQNSASRRARDELVRKVFKPLLSIVSKSYECRLKGQGATFVETTSPFTAAALGEVSPVKEKVFRGSRRQPPSPEQVQQVIIIQGYDGDFAIDASVEETAAATLQTLAMAGQMARVVHITEDGQVIATNQGGPHVGGVAPGQILSEQLAEGATQVVVVESTVTGPEVDQALPMEAVPDASSAVLQQIMKQEVLDAAEAAGHPPDASSALDALLCAVTELGEVESKSGLLDRSRASHKDFLQMPNPETANVPSDSEGQEIQMFHGVQEPQEDAEPMEVVTQVVHPSAIIASQERAQAAFKKMVQGVLQFAVCDTAAADQLMKEGVTQVIVNEEGTVHMVAREGSQIIMQEAASHTLSIQSEHMDLVDSDGQISQIIVTEDMVAQAMAQAPEGGFSDGTTHYIVTELPSEVQHEPGVYSHSVLEAAESPAVLQAGAALTGPRERPRARPAACAASRNRPRCGHLLQGITQKQAYKGTKNDKHPPQIVNLLVPSPGYREPGLPQGPPRPKFLQLVPSTRLQAGPGLPALRRAQSWAESARMDPRICRPLPTALCLRQRPRGGRGGAFEEAQGAGQPPAALASSAGKGSAKLQGKRGSEVQPSHVRELPSDSLAARAPGVNFLMVVRCD